MGTRTGSAPGAGEMTSSNNASSISIGSYQLFERVGEGASAQVYRASTADGKPVAIKLLSATAQLDDSSAHARFQREIAILAELDHPNLVKLIDHGVDEELGPYVVTPLVAGRTLRELIADRAICPEAALLILVPLLEAVAALHAVGLVHRDIKPENAIATPDGNVVVVDLGLAYRPGQTRHTDDGDVVGSIPYMAPEQIEAGEIAAPVDMWPIGVMAYEWLAGKRPFARARPAEEAAAILVGSYTPLTAADRRVGGELAAAITACLSRDATKRPTAPQLLATVRSHIDWVDDANRAQQLAAVIDDPVGYQARVAGTRVRRLQRDARDALDAGKPFDALKHIDRGLAYDPDDETLLALAGQAELASAERPSMAPYDPAAAPTPRATRWPLIGAGVAAVVGAIAIAVTSFGGSGEKVAPDRRVGKPTLPTPGQLLDRARTTSGGDDESTALAGDVFDVVQRGLALSGREERDAELAARASKPLDIRRIPLDDLSDDDDPRSSDDLVAKPGEPLIDPGEGVDTARALNEANRVAAERPTDRDALLSRAITLIASGDRDAGTAQLDALLAAHPDFGRAWEVRGYVHVRRGELDVALPAFSNALEHGGDRGTSLRNRGIVHFRLGHTRSAYADLTAAIATDPADRDALAELVRVYQRTGHAHLSLPVAERLCLVSVAARSDQAPDACRSACDLGSATSCTDR